MCLNAADTVYNTGLWVQIDGHGNFGSVDNDPAAAMRYTECRLQHFSSATFLADLDADTVDFAPNFDASQVPPCHIKDCPTVVHIYMKMCHTLCCECLWRCNMHVSQTSISTP